MIFRTQKIPEMGEITASRRGINKQINEDVTGNAIFLSTEKGTARCMIMFRLCGCPLGSQFWRESHNSTKSRDIAIGTRFSRLLVFGC